VRSGGGGGGGDKEEKSRISCVNWRLPVKEKRAMRVNFGDKEEALRGGMKGEGKVPAHDNTGRGGLENQKSVERISKACAKIRPGEKQKQTGIQKLREEELLSEKGKERNFRGGGQEGRQEKKRGGNGGAHRYFQTGRGNRPKKGKRAQANR